jgi:hypothetical protein
VTLYHSVDPVPGSDVDSAVFAVDEVTEQTHAACRVKVMLVFVHPIIAEVVVGIISATSVFHKNPILFVKTRSSPLEARAVPSFRRYHRQVQFPDPSLSNIARSPACVTIFAFVGSFKLVPL